ncbi:beta family protein [Microbacterium sp. ZW T5_56]|uniref:beta family protein n=1 Tax=Microbacterium sp. ZW T5_56 TaxID=3378081 RepID=UPI003853B4A0
MPAHYRPITLARAGELAAVAHLRAATHAAITPIFQAPPREWDFESSKFSKTLAAHLSQLPTKLSNARGTYPAFLDAGLLDAETPIRGLHPLEHLVREAHVLGLPLTPATAPDRSPMYETAVRNLHRDFGRGVAILLDASQWLTVDSSALPATMARLGMTPADIDMVIDYGAAEGPLIEAAAAAEIIAVNALGAFRSVTLGGGSFPDTQGLARGITTHPRTDWSVWRNVVTKLNNASHAIPDYSDRLILRPESIELSIDPRFISISAALRYTTEEDWLFAKGELFKGPAGTSRGGAALMSPLNALIMHPEYATPVRTQAEDWIEAVHSSQATPGNPTKWREWGTVRHFEVMEHLLARIP